ncbi:MAG: tRNA dihydrouridine(20/20a) synthase DusA [Alphaproteobacteria bacterium]|nr:tRNA dihydrouridine(20/20a) synthase DusA [Alphaproteobacteria bacterium]
MSRIQEKNAPDKISIAPMLDWTDRHFRSFLRLICRRPVFYTEMIACPALILGDKDKLLSYNPGENPLVLQVGGSDPKMMGLCAKMAEDYGYDGININAGCPSSRVQSGRFGAVLIKTPEIVADCVAEMKAKTNLPVSVKTRIALSDTVGDGFPELFRFADMMVRAGCNHLIIHARKAKLNLSPKDNRQKLPLNYEVVYRLKKSFPDVFITINGNILSLDAAEAHLSHVNGVMIGRWAYGNPYALATVDRRFYLDEHPILSRKEVFIAFLPYLEKNRDHLTVICPHLMGLFHGEPNAKAYRQALSTRDWDTIKHIPEII